MKLLAGVIGVALLGTATQVSAETIKFAIVRNGEQIGTHTMEINRAGPETSVKILTDLNVKVLFITAYRLQHKATERWVGGRLVALSSNTDNNGTLHTVSVSETSSGVEVRADGKAAKAERNLMPGSLWNQELLSRSVMLGRTGWINPAAVGRRPWQQADHRQVAHGEGASLHTQEQVDPGRLVRRATAARAREPRRKRRFGHSLSVAFRSW